MRKRWSLIWLKRNNCLGARDKTCLQRPLEHPVVRDAVAQLAEQGVSTVTLISDLSNSRRMAYVGLDNRATGRTAAYQIARLWARWPTAARRM